MDIPSLYNHIGGASARYSTDTRTIAPGDIYVAISGEQFDGNAFVQEAFDKGAVFAITSTTDFTSDTRAIVVTDTLRTLQALARHHRDMFNIPVIAIGGSNGKTTTKELIAAVLGKKYVVHATKGNLNNDIGVPLTVLAMQSNTEIAIIEIGANHPGEHVTLMNIIHPTHVLVTNNGADHLEGFGSLAGVRAANAEIFECGATYGAKAFVNSLLPDLMDDSAHLERILYPLTGTISSSNITASVTQGDTVFNSKLFGSFNEANISAAIAVGNEFGIAKSDIADAIASYEPTLKRSQIIDTDSYRIIMDCYNANPSSMELSLKDFFNTTEPCKRVIIIGDMLELGDASTKAHADILALLSSQISGDDIALIVGPRFAAYKEQYPFMFFLTSTEARTYFHTLKLSGKTIFLKASRGIRLEEVLN